MTATATRAPFKPPLGLVAILGGLCAVAPLSTDMYLPGLPQMVRTLHAPAAAGPLTVGAFYLGMCLGQLFYGPLSDRVGRRVPLLAGIALYVAASAGGALAASIDQLVLYRFLQAVGGCAGLVIARAVVRDRFEAQESAHMLSMLLLVTALGPIVAPLIGGWLLLVASWRMTFWVLTGFGLLIGIAVLLGLPESRSLHTASHARGESPFAAYRALLGEPQVMAYALAAGFTHGGFLTYLAVSPQVLISQFHVSPQAFGWVVAVNGVGLVSANYLNRRLLHRFGYDVILRRANATSVVASLLLLIDAVSGFGGLWGLVVPLFVIVAMLGFTQPNAFAGAMAHDPRRAGSTSALVGFLQFGLGAAGAAVASLLNDGTAVPMAGVIVANYLAAALALRLLGRPSAAMASA